MPSLITQWKKGKPYLYWVRSARVNGQSRIVEQVYLGPKERVMDQLHAQFTSSPHKEESPALQTVRIREFGASALFYALAQDLGLIELINAHVPPAPPRRRTSLTVGHYLVLAALNRVAWPKSKRAFAEWYQDTVLARLVPASRDELSSQRFWDHMNLFEPEHFAPIQRELLHRIQERVSPWASSAWSTTPPTTTPSFTPSTAGPASPNGAKTNRSALTCASSPWPWWSMRSGACPSTIDAMRGM